MRRRLLALFLLISLIPSLGLTLVVTFFLSRGISALRNPETEHALAQSLEVIREGIERLGTDARQHAEVLALDPATERLLGSGRTADLERYLRDEARSRGLDYICLYAMGPPMKRVFGARLGPRISLPEPEETSLRGALEQGGLITGGEAPREVSGAAALGQGHMLLAGYQLDPEIATEILALQKNLTMYRKLGVYTQLSERSLWIFAVLWTVILGILSFVLAYFVSRGTARPILDLQNAMERVSGGDLSHRVAPSGTNEVRFLGNAFNQMVEELQSSRRALVRAERLAAWREVARAVAHEIRNPLTPIQFALERLREEAKRPDAPRGAVVRENADLILNEVHSLQEFVNSFSAVAQLPEPKFQACDVASLIESVAKLYQGSTPVEFRVEVETPLSLAWADEAQVQRVMVNLIKNAMEAMGGNGAIALRARRETRDAPAVLVEVEDSGPGMDPATLERAVAPGFTTKSSGSGLGLTLVQRIVEQHAGRFGLESHPGIGTRAWFTLPFAPQAAGAAA